MATPIKWEDADFKWELAPTSPTQDRYTWDNVLLITEALGGGGDMEEMPWTKWGNEDEKRKKLVKLICKVQGKKIIKEKEIKNYKIKVSDIKMLAKEVLNIEVLTENIKL